MNKDKRFSLLNIPVDSLEPEDVETVIQQLLESKKTNHIVFLDLPLLMKAQHNQEIFKYLQEAALVIPITKSIAHGIKFLCHVNIQRYYPIDFIIQLMAFIENKGHSVYLLGGSRHVLEIADKNLRASFPGVSFVGRHFGYFNNEEEKDIISAIHKVSASFLLAGRGLKGKERWLYRESKNLNSRIVIYTHDCFDIFANKKPRISHEAFEKGGYFFFHIFFKPWRIIKYIKYYFLLLVQHFKGK